MLEWRCFYNIKVYKKDDKIMINLNKIKQSIQNKQILIFEGEMPSDILNKGFKFKNLEDLIYFCTVQNIKSCFMDIQYTDVDDYKITQDLIEERVEVNSISLKHRILDEVRKYNKILLSLDDSNPTEIIIAVLYGSNYFYYYEQEELLIEDEIILEAEDKLEEILNLFESELQEELDEHNSKIEEQKEKLKEYVLNDPDFKRCTNMRLRRQYTIDLFKNKLGREFKELKQHWSNPEILAYVYRGAIDMIEMIWRELKDKK